MDKIVQLAPDLANQIAAGEVVERPASIVKELIENALDAGAKRISITIQLGGKRQIRVEDDGEGMSPSDVKMAIERHATSKIQKFDDLSRIQTLGFRGEAIPSIASVSNFVLRSRARGLTTGTEVRVNGGALDSINEIGIPEGTSVEVGNIFYNLPARRGFLKSDTAESTQISRVVTRLALSYPEVGFVLKSGSRRLIEHSPVASLHDRMFQIYGERNDLVEVSRDSGDVRIEGYVASLSELGPTRGPQNLFINRRIIKDRTVAHAILDAYSAASIKGRSPEFHLFLQIPSDRLDVNVHPAKAEVRFKDQSYVHEVVRKTIAKALGSGPSPELHVHPTTNLKEESRTMELPGAFTGVVPSRWFGNSGVRGTATLDKISSHPASESVFKLEGGYQGLPNQVDDTRDGQQRPFMPLGQFRDTFIIATDEDGIVIIDQHVAHERVLFEKILEELTSGSLESQRLLEPLLLELSVSAQQQLLSQAKNLDRLGFMVEEFGTGALRVSAVPAVLSIEACDETLRALAEDLDGLEKTSSSDVALKQLAATTACHAAVKANDPLTYEKIVYILEGLRRTAYSTICPHGRPVMLRFTKNEIEKGFQRI
tara:strand:- start:806 stop:2602 length:1797 start_codon:yes stop_codon:yes gene_type:complete